jgi:lyso-ornithine lipid O-acyltransferase
MVSKLLFAVRARIFFLIDQVLTRFLLKVTVVTHGSPVETKKTGRLWVVNHVSFLDIMMLYRVKPLFFVTSFDVGRAGAFGLITRAAGCIFVDRNNKAQASEAVKIVHERLRLGFDVILFPEGTSSDGLSLLPFKNALFEAAFPSGIIQPVLLEYETKTAERRYTREELFFFGEQNLLQHLKNILSTRRLTAHVRFLDPVYSTQCKDRFDAAAKSRQIMLQSLSQFPTLVD